MNCVGGKKTIRMRLKKSVAWKKLSLVLTVEPVMGLIILNWHQTFVGIPILVIVPIPKILPLSLFNECIGNLKHHMYYEVVSTSRKCSPFNKSFRRNKD